MEVGVNGIVAEDGKVVTDEMIAEWESALERDEWPSGWVNVGDVLEGSLPKPPRPPYAQAGGSSK